MSSLGPLTSLAHDAAATKRIVALQDGSVIPVSHSIPGVQEYADARGSEKLEPSMI
jgi:hypothetical protein